MLRVGITGGIGSGKSLVSKILKSMNFPIFNSDSEAKRIITENKELREELITLFGKEVYSNKELNKPFLANIIFNDDIALKKVNALIHPKVRHSFEEFAAIQKSRIVFNEAAILFESGGYELMDHVILITAPEELRITRVMNRDNVSKMEVEARMSKQWSDDQKRKLTNLEIVNDEKRPLVNQIEDILMRLS